MGSAENATADSNEMAPQVLILLDVDGVLNPRLIPGRATAAGQDYLVLHQDRAELVRNLARTGKIVWATTWPAAATNQLAGDLGITVAGRIPMANIDPNASTPKLPAIQRWTHRMNATGDLHWDLLVWIDDDLDHDAAAWAQQREQPTLLLTTLPQDGLRTEHLQKLHNCIAHHRKH